MLKTIALLAAALLWLFLAAVMAHQLAPLMLTSGRPELVLLAFLLPPAWLILGLAAYIKFADYGWRERWEAPLPPDAFDQPAPAVRCWS